MGKSEINLIIDDGSSLSQFATLILRIIHLIIAELCIVSLGVFKIDELFGTDIQDIRNGVYYQTLCRKSKRYSKIYIFEFSNLE